MAIARTRDAGEDASQHTPAVMPNRQRGLLLALAATALWSTTGLLIDALTTAYRITTLELSVWRCLFITATLALLLIPRGRRRYGRPGRFSLRELAYYAAYGIVGIAAFTIVWTASIVVNKAAVATALVYSSAIFVAVGDRVLFHTRLGPLRQGAIGLNLLGCGLAAGLASPAALLHSPSGLLLGLASGLTYGAYTLFGKGARGLRRRRPLVVLFLTFVSATLFLLAWGLVLEGPHRLLAVPLALRGWALMLALALGPTLGGYACFTASLTHLSATSASLTTTLEPPLAALLALLILNRAMSPFQWAGTGLIVGGVVIMQQLARRD